MKFSPIRTRISAAAGVLSLVALLVMGGCPSASQELAEETPVTLAEIGDLVEELSAELVGTTDGWPLAIDQEMVTQPGVPTTVLLRGEDPSAELLNFTVISEPQYGQLGDIRQIDGHTAEITYTPPFDYAGQAQFSYEVDNGTQYSNVATAIIFVYPEVCFKVTPTQGEAPLIVNAQALTLDSWDLPEGEYHWTFGGVSEAGTVDTHAQRSHSFRKAGAYVISLSLTLAGSTIPIACRPCDSDTRTDTKVLVRTAVQQTPTISGKILASTGSPLAGISVTTSDGAATTTDQNGFYALTVPFGWTGTIAPQDGSRDYVPVTRDHSNVTSDRSDQIFTGHPRQSGALPPGNLSVAQSDEFLSTGLVGGPFDPVQRDYVLTNTGQAPLNWTANWSQPWLSLSNTGGTILPGASVTTTASITASANSLPAGTHNDLIVFTNTTNHNGDTSCGVTITVSSPIPQGGVLAVSPQDDFDSSGGAGGPFTPSSRDYTLENTGDQTLDWEVSSAQSWLAFSDTSGTLTPGQSQTITASLDSDANLLAPGSHTATISFVNATGGLGDTTRNVNLTVYAAPTLQVTPADGLSATGSTGGPFSPNSQSYTLTNVGGLPLQWTATNTKTWTSLSNTGGTLVPGAFAIVTVSINSAANSLPASSYDDLIQFTNTTNNIGDAQRSVLLTVAAPGDVTISGHLADGGGNPIAGATLNGLPGNPVTNANGDYSVSVSNGFSGTVTPTKAGHTFSPPTREYSNVTANLSDQNYTATLETRTISGRITDGGGSPISGVALSGMKDNPVTDANGQYTGTVDYGFTGVVTPSKAGYGFAPPTRAYVSVTSNQSNQDFTATLQTYTTSGRITDGGGTPISGVTIGGLPGSPVTNANGDYTATVDYGFSGIATPTSAGYSFTPASRTYSNVTANDSDENYTGTIQTFTISGRVTESGGALANVVMSGLPGNPVTNANGEYTATVNYGFSGTATPTLSGYSFAPPSRAYSNITANQSAQDYSGTEDRQCDTGDTSWQNFSLGEMNGLFTARFDATPDGDNIDGLTAMSSGVCGSYADMALTVRFNDAGYIDARNGGSYVADNAIPYSAGISYQFRIVVNVPAHTYSAYVTPDGGSEQTIGLNYAFRTGQEGVTSLDCWVLNAGIGAHTVCDFTVEAAGNIPPTANAGQDQIATDSDENGSESITLNGAGSSDPDGSIVSYEWFEGATPIATGPTPTITVAVGASHEYSLKVTDDDDDVDWDTVTITVNEPGSGTTAGSVSQYGITWTFSQAHEVGQYVTGDWWVVGPVTITSISPAASGGRHGSMVNPTPNKKQAYDNRNGGYDSSLVVTAPLTLAVNESIVSTASITSHPYTDVLGVSLNSNTAYTKSAAILTCVGSAPPADAFRPPYVGNSKPIYRASQLHYERLPKLPIPPSAPSLTTYERIFERPWIDHIEDWLSRAMHPADNMPNYGRELCGAVGDAGLLLCLNYTDQQKQKLTIGLTQVGIDNYHSALLNQQLWPLAGGHTIGRKFPILFAGLMLDESAFLTLDNYQNSEDMCTYYGSGGHELWTGWQNSGHQYATHAMYLFEEGTDIYGELWNHEHRHPSTWGDAPFPNNGNQSPYNKHESYKRICSWAFPGQTIAARILGLKDDWSHDAYFDYVDRWMYEDDSVNFAIIKSYWPNFIGPYDGETAWSNFARDMYFSHRPSY